MSSVKLKDPILPVVIILVLGCVAAAFYYWVNYDRQTPPPQPVAQREAPPAPEPQIRHPIPRTDAQEAKPLPPLADSDDALQDAAAGLIDQESFARFFNMNSIVRRFVVTIDELPRKKMAQRYNVAKPVAGQFRITGKGESLAINPANYRRYTPYVQLAERIDTKKLVALYVYFYPLFQEEYKNLGYPKRYFNDRLVETIDDLLAAPEIKTSLRLTQPKVLYEFADPNLEALSAGQKIMMRMGSENAAKVKAKLKEIRAEITTAAR